MEQEVDKTDVALRLLNGESSAKISKEIDFSVEIIEEWKQEFIKAGKNAIADQNKKNYHINILNSADIEFFIINNLKIHFREYLNFCVLFEQVEQQEEEDTIYYHYQMVSSTLGLDYQSQDELVNDIKRAIGNIKKDDRKHFIYIEEDPNCLGFGNKIFIEKECINISNKKNELFEYYILAKYMTKIYNNL